MEYQSVFKRYELKFLLTKKQQQTLTDSMAKYMQPDHYGRTVIRNIYFDTEDYRLIRHSIEKPAYKEKLRIRSYQQTEPDSTVFVELKKKYKSIVYKRRLAMTESEAADWIFLDNQPPQRSQISCEIDYFRKYYKALHPAIFLSYERLAYCCKDGSDFRVTFDDHILCRQNDISLQSEIYGTPLLPDNMVLMEIKCSGGIPIWMTNILSRERIYKTSFSKYGTAYQTIIFPKLKEAVYYA